MTTTPMQLSTMDWVHRRWLAFLVLAQVVALAVLLAYRSVRAVPGYGSGRPGPEGKGAGSESLDQ